jgi:tryptophan-rich sensory protein
MNVFKVNGKFNFKALILSIIIVEGTGFLSGFLGMSDSNFYSSLKKPIFSPPGFIFPIVWVILYFLMALAVYRIWMRGQEGIFINKALFLFFIQLALNFLWTIIFFRFQLFGLAFLELILLLIFILLTTFEFFKIDKVAGILMIPYILWVSFAGILNFAIWSLNEA